jgi:hypothetical protein
VTANNPEPFKVSIKCPFCFRRMRATSKLDEATARTRALDLLDAHVIEKHYERRHEVPR